MRDDGNVRLAQISAAFAAVPSKIKSTGTFRLEPGFEPNEVSILRY